MIKPDVPHNEAKRMALVNQLQILDTRPDQVLDDITAAAHAYFDVPICLVTIVDKKRQWFKSNVGLNACETTRDVSFCGHAINHDETLYVPDAEDDYRFRSNPLVLGEPHIRFYAGAPLILQPDLRVGTLCIIDRVPRELSDEQLAVLRDFADQVQSFMLSLSEHQETS